MKKEDIKSFEELVVWVKENSLEVSSSDFLNGWSHGIVESLMEQGAKQIEFDFQLKTTLLEDGTLAGYMLVVGLRIDGKPRAGSLRMFYYPVTAEGKIVGTLRAH